MIWRACERFGILPPYVKSSWDDNSPEIQSLLLGYEQGREHEDIPQII